MTGEITLTGRVLPIGGLKEKTMAAYRAGMKTVLIPAKNESDLDEVDEAVKNSLVFRTVGTIDEVFAFALDIPAAEAEPAAEKSLPVIESLPITRTIIAQ